MVYIFVFSVIYRIAYIMWSWVLELSFWKEKNWFETSYKRSNTSKFSIWDLYLWLHFPWQCGINDNFISNNLICFKINLVSIATDSSISFSYIPKKRAYLNRREIIQVIEISVFLVFHFVGSVETEISGYWLHFSFIRPGVSHEKLSYSY